MRHIGVNHMRILVGVPINLAHQYAQISVLFQEKVTEYVTNLIASNLVPNNILFGH